MHACMCTRQLQKLGASTKTKDMDRMSRNTSKLEDTTAQMNALSLALNEALRGLDETVACQIDGVYREVGERAHFARPCRHSTVFCSSVEVWPL